MRARFRWFGNLVGIVGREAGRVERGAPHVCAVGFSTLLGVLTHPNAKLQIPVSAQRLRIVEDGVVRAENVAQLLQLCVER